MRASAVFFFLILSFSVGAVPAPIPIDTAINRITFSGHIATAVFRLRALREDAKKKFVVVHFGDSHVQGDHFTGSIRTNLQTAFGNGGDGILFPYSLCKSFGPKSLTSSSTGVWTWATVLKNPDERNVGVTGYTLLTKDSNATLTFTYTPENATEATGDVSFWYGGGNATVLLNNPSAGLTLENDQTDYGRDLHRAVVHGYTYGQKISFRFSSGNRGYFDLAFYGISFDRSSGVEYNRCGVVGATFTQLIAQKEFVIRQLKTRTPDLLIFSYGSNESYNAGLKMNFYTAEINTFMLLLKEEFPETNIIITSPPDTRSGGRFPVNTQAICDSLRAVCGRTTCAFWDLHAVMGGNESINFWLNNSLARKDKLHFTKGGYELQGDLFTQAFYRAYTEQNYEPETPEMRSLGEKIVARLSALSGGKPASTITSGTEQVHEVKQGETLSSIARLHNVTVDQLCAWNNIQRNEVIRIGQKLTVKK
jgi:LysM repeat protein